ncbi:tetrathionate reductase family octaheme c-type cytochrome [Marinobacter sp. ES-1]|uniref:tetrathionate reductase family octaheme c-type cytochrome n=1 Tax=Marinobacter sp. ES-1 TaxID=1396858 RepID=UPI00056A5E52|nr:tetrathionate reductase family octaheme c-type cytochrome [Marinobacter sp. ES-1]
MNKDAQRMVWRTWQGWAAVLCLFLALPAMALEKSPTTADHSKFKALQGPFEKAEDVTAACLECHTEAGEQIRGTTHWTWLYDHQETGQTLGKSKVINSFCGMAVTNESRCTSCHVGYGWKDMNQPPPQAENAVDCLVCHDTTGDYWKFPTLAGYPTSIPREWPKGSGKMVMPPDLEHIAQNVGASGRANCGSCHFHGGGADGVKHGDLDSSLINPPKELDVHMSPDGLNFGCSDCHTTMGHAVSGSRYQANARDTLGIDVPGHTDFSRASCESCHGLAPHDKPKLNDHVDKLACQSCHIPAFARGGVATKTWWDWSTAGRLDEDGKPVKELDENGHPSYLSEKGDFRHGENVVPEYAWFDGTVQYTLAGDPLDIDNPPVAINKVEGSPDDGKSRIWPFKVMRGKQPFDTERQTLLATHVFGADDSSLWSNFNWEKALQAGSDMSGMPYSGQFDFIETTMHWPITHMVAPANDAVKCGSCHKAESRLAGLGGIYMPGHHSNVWLDRIGWLLVAATLFAVLVHAMARIVFSGRKGQ